MPNWPRYRQCRASRTDTGSGTIHHLATIVPGSDRLVTAYVSRTVPRRDRERSIRV